MHRSKLELYEEVLQALATKPLTIDSLAYQCNTDCILLNKRLEFLTKNGLIQKETHKNKTLYTLTKRGTAISKTLTITKRLEKLQTTIKQLNNTLQEPPTISEHTKTTPKRTRQNENY